MYLGLHSVQGIPYTMHVCVFTHTYYLASDTLRGSIPQAYVEIVEKFGREEEQNIRHAIYEHPSQLVKCKVQQYAKFRPGASSATV
jgi:hypothetical protein